MDTKTMTVAFLVIAFLAFVVAVNAFFISQCGWEAFLYGKNVFWAWLMGYCQ